MKKKILTILLMSMIVLGTSNVVFAATPPYKPLSSYGFTVPKLTVSLPENYKTAIQKAAEEAVKNMFNN